MDKVKVLERYLPPAAAPLIARWIDYFKCEFKISRNRNSKFGDYRAPHAGKGHRISVNYDLNAYAFLVTTVHEFAHLHTWNEHKHKAKPHGAEWKANFKKMMQPFFDQQVFEIGMLHSGRPVNMFREIAWQRFPAQLFDQQGQQTAGYQQRKLSTKRGGFQCHLISPGFLRAICPRCGPHASRWSEKDAG